MSHDQHIQAREAASKIKMSNNAKERTRVYVGDLGSGGSKPELEREFEHFGPLRSVWVARNPPGFAFIEYEDPRDAQDAANDMDGRHVCGVKIRCELAKNTSRPGPGGRNYRGPPPPVVSSRYRKSPPAGGRHGRGRSRSPRYNNRDSRSPSPRRSRSRSPYRGSSPPNRRGSPPYRRSPRERGRGYY